MIRVDVTGGGLIEEMKVERVYCVIGEVLNSMLVCKETEIEIMLSGERYREDITCSRKIYVQDKNGIECSLYKYETSKLQMMEVK